jgi:hypothetical protein
VCSLVHAIRAVPPVTEQRYRPSGTGGAVTADHDRSSATPRAQAGAPERAPGAGPIAYAARNRATDPNARNSRCATPRPGLQSTTTVVRTAAEACARQVAAISAGTHAGTATPRSTGVGNGRAVLGGACDRIGDDAVAGTAGAALPDPDRPTATHASPRTTASATPSPNRAPAGFTAVDDHDHGHGHDQGRPVRGGDHGGLGTGRRVGARPGPEPPGWGSASGGAAPGSRSGSRSTRPALPRPTRGSHVPASVSPPDPPASAPSSLVIPATFLHRAVLFTSCHILSRLCTVSYGGDMHRTARLGFAVCLLGGEAGAALVLGRLGRVTGFGPPHHGLGHWLLHAPTEDLIATAGRLVGLTLAWWLLGATALSVARRVVPRWRHLRALDALTPRSLRHLLDRGLALGIGASLAIGAVPPAGASAARGPTRAPAATVSARGDQPVPRTPATVVATPPPRGASPAAPPPPRRPDARGTRVVVVRTGDNLWVIARRALRPAGTEPRANEIAPYWRQVVIANAATLRSHDPDLIFPGERVVLPAPGDGGPGGG